MPRRCPKQEDGETWDGLTLATGVVFSFYIVGCYEVVFGSLKDAIALFNLYLFLCRSSLALLFCLIRVPKYIDHDDFLWGRLTPTSHHGSVCQCSSSAVDTAWATGLSRAVPDAEYSCKPWLFVRLSSHGIVLVIHRVEIADYLSERPHSGSNITVALIENAFTKFLNVELEFAMAAKEFTQAWGHDIFDLDDLNAPDILQHISSLTREDYTSQHPHLEQNLNRIERLLDDSPTPFVNIDSIARTRLRVQAESKPNALSENQVNAALTEAAMTLVMMSDHAPDARFNPPLSAYQGPKDRIRTWFEQERFPTELGWRPSRRVIKVADLNPAMNGISKSMEQQGRNYTHCRLR